jgi:hypothetical protein
MYVTGKLLYKKDDIIATAYCYCYCFTTRVLMWKERSVFSILYLLFIKKENFKTFEPSPVSSLYGLDIRRYYKKVVRIILYIKLRKIIIIKIINKWVTHVLALAWYHLDKCIRCGIETSNTSFYSCEHTKEEKMCTECYQEIHWHMSNR